MEYCHDCNKCFDYEMCRNKCCDCSNMIILEYDGWIRYCFLHDLLCSDVVDEGCEDFKAIKEKGEKVK